MGAACCRCMLVFSFWLRPALWARYCITILALSVFPAPDSPLTRMACCWSSIIIAEKACNNANQDFHHNKTIPNKKLDIIISLLQCMTDCINKVLPYWQRFAFLMCPNMWLNVSCLEKLKCFAVSIHMLFCANLGVQTGRGSKICREERQIRKLLVGGVDLKFLALTGVRQGHTSQGEVLKLPVPQ